MRFHRCGGKQTGRQCRPEVSREGIRFLDEAPEPTRPPAGATPERTARKSTEWPVGLIAFLAVVGGGLLWRAAQQDGVTAREVFEERFEVGEAPRIEVDAARGSVRIGRGADRVVVCRVEAEGRGATDEEAARALGLLRPIMRSVGDVVSIRIPGDAGHGPRPGGASIRLEVPEQAQVRVVTGRGSVTIRDVRGSIAARTARGKIEVEGAAGPIVLDTKDGSISCEANEALLLATTQNGSIRFRGTLAEGTSRLATRNGSVKVRLPEHGVGVVDATSGNGGVRSDFPTARTARPSGVIPVGLAGQGESRLEIRTGNGAIRVERE